MFLPSCICILSVSMAPHSLLCTWEKQFSFKTFCNVQDSHLFIHTHIISGTKTVQKAHLLQTPWICPEKSFSLTRSWQPLKANQDTRSLLSSVPRSSCSYSVSQWKTKSREKTQIQLTERIVSVLLYTCSYLLLSFAEGVKSPSFSFCNFEESDCSTSLSENPSHL